MRSEEMYRATYSWPLHSWRWMVSFVLQPLSPRRRRTLYPRIWTSWRGKGFSPYRGSNLTPRTPIQSLYWLCCPSSAESGLLLSLRTLSSPLRPRLLWYSVKWQMLLSCSDSELRHRTKRTRHVRKFGVISWHFENVYVMQPWLKLEKLLNVSRLHVSVV
jgi:hypothetical protein